MDYTHQEKDFADLVAGPDASMFDHLPREARPHGSTAPSEAHDMVRKKLWQRARSWASFKRRRTTCTPAWASTRVANDPEIAFETLMEEMLVQYGLGELAAEAAALLEAHGQGLKAGHQARCQLGDTRWEGEGPGRSLAHIVGVLWALWDFGEMVYMTEELAGLLGVIEPEKETRRGSASRRCWQRDSTWRSMGRFPLWRRSKGQRRSFGWSRQGWPWRLRV